MNSIGKKIQLNYSKPKTLELGKANRNIKAKEQAQETEVRLFTH